RARAAGHSPQSARPDGCATVSLVGLCLSSARPLRGSRGGGRQGCAAQSEVQHRHAQQTIAPVKLGRMGGARAAAGPLLQLMPELRGEMLTRAVSAPSEMLADWGEALRSAGIPG